jgi:hypothetical protein
MAEGKQPIHSETEAEAIRKRNERRATAEARKRLRIRRAIELRQEAKEAGIDWRELDK